MYLLDTKVIFELRKPRPHGAVLAWLQAVDNANLQLASVSLGEIQAGIGITREQDAAKASAIEAWLDQLSESSTILPKSALIWATTAVGRDVQAGQWS